MSAGFVGGLSTELAQHTVTASTAERLRHRFAEIGYQRYSLFDRGSYEYATTKTIAEIDSLIAEICQLTHRNLKITNVRALRFGPGDYLLSHHDQYDIGLPLELTIDISATTTNAPIDAPVIYRRNGQPFFMMPCVALSAALVERGPMVNCSHGYVRKLHVNAEIVRLTMKLQDVD
jgi:hypothetical protein